MNVLRLALKGPGQRSGIDKANFAIYVKVATSKEAIMGVQESVSPTRFLRLRVTHTICAELYSIRALSNYDLTTVSCVCAYIILKPPNLSKLL